MARSLAKRVAYTVATHFKLCLICQKGGGNLVKTPGSSCLRKLLKCVGQRARYGDPGFVPINSRLRDLQQSELESYEVSWHRVSYQNTVHPTKIQRAKERYEKSLHNKNVTVITNVKSGRPQTPIPLPGTQPSTVQEKEKPFTRSSAVQYNPRRCIFCNKGETKQAIHQVCLLEVGRKIREIVEKSDNSDWKVRLQPDDARVIGVKYHRVCYITASRRFMNPAYYFKEGQKQKDSTSYSESVISADTEYISLVKTTLCFLICAV